MTSTPPVGPKAVITPAPSTDRDTVIFNGVRDFGTIGNILHEDNHPALVTVPEADIRFRALLASRDFLSGRPLTLLRIKRNEKSILPGAILPGVVVIEDTFYILVDQNVFQIMHHLQREFQRYDWSIATAEMSSEEDGDSSSLSEELEEEIEEIEVRDPHISSLLDDLDTHLGIHFDEFKWKYSSTELVLLLSLCLNEVEIQTLNTRSGHLPLTQERKGRVEKVLSAYLEDGKLFRVYRYLPGSKLLLSKVERSKKGYIYFDDPESLERAQEFILPALNVYKIGKFDFRLREGSQVSPTKSRLGSLRIGE